jgi:regulator of replication initiation timing
MRIDDMYAEMQKLKYENQKLATSNKRLKVEREQLATERSQLQENLATTETARKQVEEVASTLHASNLNIIPIEIKGNGKEKETTTAKKVDLLRISFVLDENRVATSGNKELYVTGYRP